MERLYRSFGATTLGESIVYQGVLDDKEKPFARFLQETASHDNSVDYALRYPELVVLWEHIFAILRPDRRRFTTLQEGE